MAILMTTKRNQTRTRFGTLNVQAICLKLYPKRHIVAACAVDGHNIEPLMQDAGLARRFQGDTAESKLNEIQ